MSTLRATAPDHLSDVAGNGRREPVGTAGGRRLTDESGYTHYRIGEVRVALRSDRPDVLEEFASLYSPTAAPSDEVTSDCDVIHMEVRQHRSLLGMRRFEVLGDNVSVKTVRSRRELLPYLEWGINYRLIARPSRYLLIHAASLARNGQGYIFCGASGAGKSTLAAALIARGWTYRCDEFALIDRQTLRMHAFPKALCIKAGSFPLMAKLNLPLRRDRCYVKALKGRVGYVNPPSASQPGGDTSVPVKHVFFPMFRGGTQPRLFDVSPAKATMILAGQALNRSTVGPQTIPLLSRVVSDAPCYGLESGTLESTCEMIESATAPAGK